VEGIKAKPGPDLSPGPCRAGGRHTGPFVLMGPGTSLASICGRAIGTDISSICMKSPHLSRREFFAFYYEYSNNFAMGRFCSPTFNPDFHNFSLGQLPITQLLRASRGVPCLGGHMGSSVFLRIKKKGLAPEKYLSPRDIFILLNFKISHYHILGNFFCILLGFKISVVLPLNCSGAHLFTNIVPIGGLLFSVSRWPP